MYFVDLPCDAANVKRRVRFASYLDALNWAGGYASKHGKRAKDVLAMIKRKA